MDIPKNKLERLKRKNRGNSKLVRAVDKLIQDIELKEWRSPDKLKQDRPDADCVHGDGFYFFDINIHRTMILVEFGEDNEATIVWAGSHQDYELLFKNNKNTIKKWLRDNEWI